MTRNMSEKYFYDPLYGCIQFEPFIYNLILSCPELLRLREIRMSSVKFVLFPGFADSTRFEHSIGTGYLAQSLSNRWKLNKKDRMELIIAALFHDVATPPFGHLFESLIPEFDHEFETAKLIIGETTEFRRSDSTPIFCGETPKLRILIERFNQKAKAQIDIKNIYNYIVGEGKFGRLIKSDIDLDNIDNVYRAAYHIGIEVDKSAPIKIVEGYELNENSKIYYQSTKHYLIEEWLRIREKLYTELLLNIYDFNLETVLKYVIKKAIETHMIKLNYRFTDYDLISRVLSYRDKIADEEYAFKDALNQLRLGSKRKLLTTLGLFWISEKEFVEKYIFDNKLREEIETKLRDKLIVEVTTNFMLDKRSRAIRSLQNFEELPLFREKNKRPLGKEKHNLLLGVFSPKKTLVKRRTVGGKAVLDSNKRQIILKKAYLKRKCIDVLKSYVGTVREFDPNKMRLGKELNERSTN